MEVLLRRVELLGHGELPAAGYAGRTWTVVSLRAEVCGRADDLAARFDARNGTTAHTDRRRARLDRAPLLDTLELTLRPRRLDDVALGAPVVAPTARTLAAAPDSLPELILEARTLEEQGHPDAHACWARLRTLVAARDYTHPDDPAVGPLVQLRADLLADEANRAARRTSSPTPPPSMRRPRPCTTMPDCRGTRRSPAPAPCSPQQRSPRRAPTVPRRRTPR